MLTHRVHWCLLNLDLACTPEAKAPPVAQGDHEKPNKQLEAANVQAKQPEGLKDAAQMPEAQRQVSCNAPWHAGCVHSEPH